MMCTVTDIAWAELNPSYPTDHKDTFKMAEVKARRLFFSLLKTFQIQFQSEILVPAHFIHFK